MEYKKQIIHPKWQKKRLEILERDKFRCQHCGSNIDTLNVHHLIYHKNKMIWEYSNKYLITFCNDCHYDWHRIKDNINETLCVNLDVLEGVFNILNGFKNTNTSKLKIIHSIIKKLKQFKNV